VTTTVRQARFDDLPAVEALRRADGDALGFVPKAKYEHITLKTSDRGRDRWKYEWLIVAEDNEEITGFFLAGFHRDGAKGQQLCVRQDARRMERALKLVDAVETEARKRGSLRIRHRVAADIEANFFWRAAGYTPIAVTTSTWLNVKESASKRPLLIYDKPLDQGSLFGLTVGSTTVPTIGREIMSAFMVFGSHNGDTWKNLGKVEADDTQQALKKGSVIGSMFSRIAVTPVWSEMEFESQDTLPAVERFAAYDQFV
jgi:GNAT superfamily N-acetyltransferase